MHHIFLWCTKGSLKTKSHSNISNFNKVAPDNPAHFSYPSKSKLKLRLALISMPNILGSKRGRGQEREGGREDPPPQQKLLSSLALSGQEICIPISKQLVAVVLLNGPKLKSRCFLLFHSKSTQCRGAG